MEKGTLFIVATPIGNLDDLSPRATKILAEVDLVAAEDTRHTGRLLSHFGVKTPQIALHDHNEKAASSRVIEALLAGKNVALVSDAGTPAVSDPGYDLLRAAHEKNITVSPLPGPSALTAALSASGLPSDRFSFEGFLPAKRAARQKRIAALQAEPRTMVFFEARHRIRDMLDDLADGFGADRPGFIGRELSKLHEQCVAADLGTLRSMLADERIPERGEFVVLVRGAEEKEDDDVSEVADRLLTLLVTALPGSQAVDLVAQFSGENRNALYRHMLRLAPPRGDG